MLLYYLVVDNHGQYNSNLFGTTYDIGRAKHFSSIDEAKSTAAKLNDTWRVTTNKYRVVRLTLEELDDHQRTT